MYLIKAELSVSGERVIWLWNGKRSMKLWSKPIKTFKKILCHDNERRRRDVILKRFRFCYCYASVILWTGFQEAQNGMTKTRKFEKTNIKRKLLSYKCIERKWIRWFWQGERSTPMSEIERDVCVCVMCSCAGTVLKLYWISRGIQSNETKTICNCCFSSSLIIIFSRRLFHQLFYVRKHFSRMLSMFCACVFFRFFSIRCVAKHCFFPSCDCCEFYLCQTLHWLTNRLVWMLFLFSLLVLRHSFDSRIVQCSVRYAWDVTILYKVYSIHIFEMNERNVYFLVIYKFCYIYMIRTESKQWSTQFRIFVENQGIQWCLLLSSW